MSREKYVYYWLHKANNKNIIPWVKNEEYMQQILEKEYF